MGEGFVNAFIERVNGAMWAAYRRWFPIALHKIHYEERPAFYDRIHRAYKCWTEHSTIAKGDLYREEEVARIIRDCKLLGEKPDWLWEEYLLLAEHRDDVQRYCAALWGHFQRGSPFMFVSYLGVNRALMTSDNRARRDLLKNRLMGCLFNDLRDGDLEKIEVLVFEMTPPRVSGETEYLRTAIFFEQEATAHNWCTGRLDVRYLQPRLDASGPGRSAQKYLCVALRPPADRTAVARERANEIIRFVYDDLYPSAYPVHDAHTQSDIDRITAHRKYLASLRDQVMVQQDVRLLSLRP